MEVGCEAPHRALVLTKIAPVPLAPLVLLGVPLATGGVGITQGMNAVPYACACWLPPPHNLLLNAHSPI
ncbi:hypothetical protein DFH08DRAFT_968826 [Mycena albidolilacea]|uniref:Uncharacterized protein n=1 Tax=Mycena albidolilacea TaxID=1033008 RepID=A0AAD6ZII4_9AGAR|nr:hypothetical protein DFH08DRAFT_968826 [Mycena albidolilacea]